jgi:arylamine N-acetyltransferase
MGSIEQPQANFTSEEIKRYLDYIELPAKYGLESPKTVEFLTALHVHQISKVPYENLSVHYSPDHKIIIHPRFMYDKILNGRNRGGYCMEISVFFGHLLQSLGFEVYRTGVRIRARANSIPVGDYTGL